MHAYSLPAFHAKIRTKMYPRRAATGNWPGGWKRNGPLLPKPLSDDKLSYADFVISLVLLWRKHHSFESHSTLYQDQALHLLHYPTLGSPLCNDHATLVNLSATNFMNYSAETSKDMAACTRDMILKLELFYRPRHASELTNLFGSKSHNG
jgi:hypothetical protein